MPLLSVIVTTNGSEQFYYSICALREQMRPFDELIVISNGRHPESRKIVLNTIGNRPNVTFVEIDSGTPESLRKNGWLRSKGVRLLFLDEKDLIVRGALDLIREKVEEFDEFPLLFLSKKIGGRSEPDVLVPYNNWPGSSDSQSIIHKQGEPILINQVVVLTGVPIDTTFSSLLTT